MKLTAYRKLTGKTQEQMAEEIGCTQAAYSRYEAGLRRPRPEVLIRIHDATSGQVTANDFYDLPALDGAAQQGRAA